MDLVEGFQLFSHFVFADKGHYFNKTMKHETIDKAIQTNARVLGTPVFIRYSLTFNTNRKVKRFIKRFRGLPGLLCLPENCPVFVFRSENLGRDVGPQCQERRLE